MLQSTLCHQTKTSKFLAQSFQYVILQALKQRCFHQKYLVHCISFTIASSGWSQTKTGVCPGLRCSTVMACLIIAGGCVASSNNGRSVLEHLCFAWVFHVVNGMLPMVLLHLSHFPTSQILLWLSVKTVDRDWYMRAGLEHYWHYNLWCNSLYCACDINV